MSQFLEGKLFTSGSQSVPFNQFLKSSEQKVYKIILNYNYSMIDGKSTSEVIEKALGEYVTDNFFYLNKSEKEIITSFDNFNTTITLKVAIKGGTHCQILALDNVNPQNLPNGKIEDGYFVCSFQFHKDRIKPNGVNESSIQIEFQENVKRLVSAIGTFKSRIIGAFQEPNIISEVDNLIKFIEERDKVINAAENMTL